MTPYHCCESDVFVLMIPYIICCVYCTTGQRFHLISYWLLCYRYKLELVGRDRKLTWEAKPRSIHEGIASVISSTNCLIFETTMAEYFAENGNLPINVTIMKSFF